MSSDDNKKPNDRNEARSTFNSPPLLEKPDIRAATLSRAKLRVIYIPARPVKADGSDTLMARRGHKKQLSVDTTRIRSTEANDSQLTSKYPQPTLSPAIRSQQDTPSTSTLSTRSSSKISPSQSSVQTPLTSPLPQAGPASLLSPNSPNTSSLGSSSPRGLFRVATDLFNAAKSPKIEQHLRRNGAEITGELPPNLKNGAVVGLHGKFAYIRPTMSPKTNEMGRFELPENTENKIFKVAITELQEKNPRTGSTVTIASSPAEKFENKMTAEGFVIDTPPMGFEGGVVLKNVGEFAYLRPTISTGGYIDNVETMQKTLYRVARSDLTQEAVPGKMAYRKGGLETIHIGLDIPASIPSTPQRQSPSNGTKNFAALQEAFAVFSEGTSIKFSVGLGRNTKVHGQSVVISTEGKSARYELTAAEQRQIKLDIKQEGQKPGQQILISKTANGLEASARPNAIKSPTIGQQQGNVKGR